jgi:hypothetical protein
VRKPTPTSEQLERWRWAVANKVKLIPDEDVHCGWFKQRERAWSKTWLPAKIWLHQKVEWSTGQLMEPELFVLEIAGRKWTDQEAIEERSRRLQPISVDEWRWLMARTALHRSHGTLEPVWHFG